MYIYSLFQL
ncbi:unnamed protein product [Callosobruchus maculatus]|uniref:Uncharacterized protein n=1 Tax=Callosobruchus maculatus TaxID=64391 RepID=A0A653CJ43_CALMS|nr:unnamed protein product [Callosobruchus maculatus]